MGLGLLIDGDRESDVVGDGPMLIGGSIDVFGFNGVTEWGGLDLVVLSEFGVYELPSCAAIDETSGVDVSVFLGDADRDVHALVTCLGYQHGSDAQRWRDSRLFLLH